jgi:hypothetical protein
MGRRFALVSLAALVFVGCQDSQSPTPFGDGPPSLDISDGSQPGGNQDFFFLPPIVPNPSGTPNFDEGEFNPNLVLDVVICELDGLECVEDVDVPSPGEMTLSLTNEQYQVTWHTQDSDLTPLVNYRVSIVLSNTSTVLGFRDVRPVDSPQEVPSNPETLDFYVFLNGSSIPLKVRTENGLLCDPSAAECVSATVNLTDDGGEVSLANGDNVFVPIQGAGGNTTLTVQTFCPDLPLDIPLFGRCIDINADPPPAELDPLAIVSLCSADFSSLSHDQEDLVTLHKMDDAGNIVALPHATADCPEVASAPVSGTGFMRFARAGWNALTGLMVPKPLYARRGDFGPAGAAGSFSQFQFALPAKMDVFEGDEQVAPAGTALGTDPAVWVTDANGDPVAGATVRFQSPAPDGLANPTPDGSATPATMVTGANGMAITAWTLSNTPGLNELDAFGRGIAGPDDNPRPFAPPVPSGGSPAVSVGTGSLTFSAIGCEPGAAVGTAEVDGMITDAEWACAQSQGFTANLSGGDTQATLYWMSDADNLYLAVRVARDREDRVNSVRFNFDNNNSTNTSGTGEAELGDDIIFYDADNGFGDHFLTEKCTNSSQTSCGKADDKDTAKGGEIPPNGTVDGTGDFFNDGMYSMYELAHPLNSGDLHDFALSAGDKVGVFVTLQLGNGAQGNTQYPGFRNYLEIMIGDAAALILAAQQ